MTQSTYPNGFPNGVTIRGVPIQQTHMGKIFYVNGTSVPAPGGVGGSNGNKGTYLAPFATIVYALTKCVSGRGDIIVVAPNHAETVSDATSFDVTKNNVAIVGLGTTLERPTITVDTATTSTINVNADGVTFANMRIVAGFADVASAFTIIGESLTIDNCYIGLVSAGLNFVACFTIGAADYDSGGFTVSNCTIYDVDTASTSVIASTYTQSGIIIEDNYIQLGVNTSDLPVICALPTGKFFAFLQVLRNRIIRLNDANALLLTTDSASNSGIVADNFVRHADTAGELLVSTGTGLGFFNNYATAADDASGFLLPAADS